MGAWAEPQPILYIISFVLCTPFLIPSPLFSYLHVLTLSIFPDSPALPATGRPRRGHLPLLWPSDHPLLHAERKPSAKTRPRFTIIHNPTTEHVQIFRRQPENWGGGWLGDSGRQQLARRPVCMFSLFNQSAFPYMLFSHLLTPPCCPALFCPSGKRCFTNLPANSGLNFNFCFLPWPHTAQICRCCAVWRASVSQKWTNHADSLQTALIYVQLSPGANRQVNKAWQRWGDTLSVNCCPSLFKYIVCLCNILLQGVKPCTGDKLLLCT